MSCSNYHNIEPSPYCSIGMSMDELMRRRSFLKRSLETYYTNIEHLNNECTVDPSKFKKLKAYNEKRLKETDECIRKKEQSNRSHVVCTTV